MNEIIIKGGSHRYLSELDLFKNGLPDGIINKTKPDVGGTYSAANCDKNYIIREFGIRKGLKKLVISSKIRIFIGENQQITRFLNDDYQGQSY